MKKYIYMYTHTQIHRFRIYQIIKFYRLGLHDCLVEDKKVGMQLSMIVER